MHTPIELEQRNTIDRKRCSHHCALYFRAAATAAAALCSARYHHHLNRHPWLYLLYVGVRTPYAHDGGAETKDFCFQSIGHCQDDWTCRAPP